MKKARSSDGDHEFFAEIIRRGFRKFPPVPRTTEQMLIDRHLAERGVTKCPTAVCAPTAAVPDSESAVLHRQRGEEQERKDTARRMKVSGWNTSVGRDRLGEGMRAAAVARRERAAMLKGSK